MKNAFIVLISLLLFISCKPKSENKSAETKKTSALTKGDIKKIDVHAHYQYSRDYIPDFFKEWNMQGVLVDVAKAEATGIGRAWENYMAHAKIEPNLFFLCSSLIGVGIDAPDYAKKEIERLEKEINQGARMVKVWKNFGMVTKDNSGKFIQIDDVRLQPIWDFLAKKNIPVMSHIGEPVQAWRPLDEPNNPHYGYYSRNPEYHAYKHPEIPSYETIISARDNWITANPNLTMLCAHLGSMSHDVDMVTERLDKFPNMLVECGARFGDLAGQDSEKIRDFFDTYQNRILFGSDYGTSTPQDSLSVSERDEELKNLNTDYTRLWDYLSSNDSLEIRNQKTEGLQLPDRILTKVYYENAANLLKIN